MFPCVVPILLENGPELQRHRLREAVVDVIERARIDVVLALPALALAVEGDLAVQTHPRHIDAEQLLPHGMALRRGEIRLLIHDVLEVVHHGAVGDEGERVREMAVAELRGILAEEAVAPRPGEKFHGHGVNLARLHRGPHERGGHAVAVQIAGEGMARLVRDDFHVVLGAVEVCEDEGHAVIGNGRAVAAAFLAGRGEHVHQVDAEHRAEELARLGGELVIELFALGQDVVRAAGRARVAGGKAQRLVRKAERIRLAEPLGLCAADAVRQRDEIFHDGGAELLHVRLAVAVALHAVVAERGVALKAKLFAHLVAQVHEPVIDLVHFRLVFLIPAALGLPGGQALGVVGARLEGGELRKRVGAALEGNLRAGQQLFIFLREVIFLLHVRHNHRGEGLAGDLRVQKRQRAVFLLEFGAEGRGEQRFGEGVVVFLELRACAVPEFLFAVVKPVARVDAVADARQRGLRAHMLFELLTAQKRRAGLFIGGSSAKLLRPFFVLRLHRVQIRALVGHFRKGGHDHYSLSVMKVEGWSARGAVPRGCSAFYYTHRVPFFQPVRAFSARTSPAFDEWPRLPYNEKERSRKGEIRNDKAGTRARRD